MDRRRELHWAHRLFLSLRERTEVSVVQRSSDEASLVTSSLGYSLSLRERVGEGPLAQLAEQLTLNQ